MRDWGSGHLNYPIVKYIILKHNLALKGSHSCHNAKYNITSGCIIPLSYSFSSETQSTLKDLWARLVGRDHKSRGLLGIRHAKTPPAPRNLPTPQKSVTEERRSPRVAEIGLQAHRRGKHQPVTAGPTNTKDNQVAKGKHRNIANRNQSNGTIKTQLSHNSKSWISPTHQGSKIWI